MTPENIGEIPEDVYILEALRLELLVLTDNLMRFAAVDVNARCAYTFAAVQIDFADKAVPLDKLYPDPKQVPVLRILLTHGTLLEFRKLDPSLQAEMVAHWERIILRPWEEVPKADQEKYGRLWIQCSNRAYEAMNVMTLVPEPDEDSEYWDRLMAVVEALKDSA